MQFHSLRFVFQFNPVRALHYDLTCQIRPEIEVNIFSFKKTECTQIFAYRNLKIGKTDGTVNDVFCSFSGDFKCPCSHTRCEQPCALLHVRTLLQNRLRGTWKIMLATRMASDT